MPSHAHYTLSWEETSKVDDRWISDKHEPTLLADVSVLLVRNEITWSVYIYYNAISYLPFQQPWSSDAINSVCPPYLQPHKMFAFMHACICGDVMQQCPEVDNTHLVYICGFVPKAFFGPPLCLLRLKDCAPASYLILGFIDPSYTAPLLHTVTYFCSLCLSFWVGSVI